MLKTIKIPSEAYEDAKKLTKSMEKGRVIIGVYKVKISTAVSYAIRKALEDIKNRERLISAAGGWSDINANRMIREIHEGRVKGTRWNTRLG